MTRRVRIASAVVLRREACRHNRSTLADAALGISPLGPAALAHLESCGRCRSELRALLGAVAELDRVGADLRSLRASASGWPMLLARLPADVPRDAARPRSRRQQGGLDLRSLSLAAIPVLVAVLLWPMPATLAPSDPGPGLDEATAHTTSAGPAAASRPPAAAPVRVDGPRAGPVDLVHPVETAAEIDPIDLPPGQDVTAAVNDAGSGPDVAPVEVVSPAPESGSPGPRVDTGARTVGSTDAGTPERANAPPASRSVPLPR